MCHAEIWVTEGLQDQQMWWEYFNYVEFSEYLILKVSQNTISRPQTLGKNLRLNILFIVRNLKFTVYECKIIFTHAYEFINYYGFLKALPL